MAWLLNVQSSRWEHPLACAASPAVLGSYLMGSASLCNHQDRPWDCALGLVDLSTFQGVLLVWKT